MQNNGVAALPHSYLRQRTARVKFQGSLLALVQLDNGSALRVPVHQLSANGGLLHMPDPMAERLKVYVALHVGSTTLRTEAEMLKAMWATRGCLQPFRFTDLAVNKRTELKENLEILLKRGRGRRALKLQWSLTTPA